MLVKMETQAAGGVDDQSRFFDLTSYDMTTITDSNPLVLEGTFSNITQLFARGKYTSSGSYSSNYQNDYLDNIELGTTYKVKSGSTSAYQGWRNVTIYADRIEIGSGGYSTSTINSDYGILEHLAVGELK